MFSSGWGTDQKSNWKLVAGPKPGCSLTAPHVSTVNTVDAYKITFYGHSVFFKNVNISE